MIENAELTEEITEALGRAVVTNWGKLPHDIQQLLFEAAVRANDDANGFRGALAIFLHDHNPRTADSSQMALPEDDDEDDLPPLFPPGRSGTA